MKLLKNILKDKGSNDYSRGGIYLFVSVVAYFLSLFALFLVGVIYKINVEDYKMIIEFLEYAMTLFGGYVFGGKFIQAYQSIKSTTNDKGDETEIK